MSMDNKEYQRQYAKTHREQRRETLRRWRKNNPEKKARQNYIYKRAHRKGTGQTALGRKYELLAVKMLKGAIDKNQESMSGSHDIEWNGWRVDVKMRNIKKRGFWSFRSHEECKLDADYFLLFCVENNKIYKVLMMPKSVFRRGVYMGKKSKYDAYKLLLPIPNL